MDNAANNGANEMNAVEQYTKRMMNLKTGEGDAEAAAKDYAERYGCSADEIVAARTALVFAGILEESGGWFFRVGNGGY